MDDLDTIAYEKVGVDLAKTVVNKTTVNNLDREIEAQAVIDKAILNYEAQLVVLQTEKKG